MAKKQTKTLEELSKKYGKYLITSNSREDIKPRFHETPFPSFNNVTGGGIPLGRAVHIYSKESCSKTSLALALIANTKGKLAFIDFEKTMDFDYAENVLGVNPDNLIITKPMSLEDGLEMTSDLLEICDFVVFDSVAAAKAKSTWEKSESDVGKEVIAATARVLSSYLPILSDKMFTTGNTVIFINQMRVDPAQAGPYSDGMIPTGGNSLRYETTLGLRLYASKDQVTVDGTKQEQGRNIRIKVEKNKLFQPGVETSLYYTHLKGFDITRDVINMAEAVGIVVRGGAWYNYKDQKFQGIDKFSQFLEDNPELREEIVKQLNEVL